MLNLHAALLTAAVFAVLLAYPIYVSIQGTREDRKRKYKLLFCSECGKHYSKMGYLDDMSRPMGESVIEKRYCDNGHGWVVRALRTHGGGESQSSYLGGWAP